MHRESGSWSWEDAPESGCRSDSRSKGTGVRSTAASFRTESGRGPEPGRPAADFLAEPVRTPRQQLVRTLSANLLRGGQAVLVSTPSNYASPQLVCVSCVPRSCTSRAGAEDFLSALVKRA